MSFSENMNQSAQKLAAQERFCESQKEVVHNAINFYANRQKRATETRT